MAAETPSISLIAQGAAETGGRNLTSEVCKVLHCSPQTCPIHVALGTQATHVDVGDSKKSAPWAREKILYEYTDLLQLWKDEL